MVKEIDKWHNKKYPWKYIMKQSLNLVPEMYAKQTNDTHSIVAIKTLLAPVSFCQKTNTVYPNLNLNCLLH